MAKVKVRIALVMTMNKARMGIALVRAMNKARMGIALVMATVVMLKYKAKLVGIKVVLTEESCTSQASFLDRDEVSVYNSKREDKLKFSGKRAIVVSIFGTVLFRRRAWVKALRR